MSDNPQIERVLAMTERLTRMLEADIAALQNAKPMEMRSIEPEMQQLSALYSREAQALRAQFARSGATAPAALVAATKDFREALALQTRLLTRVRNATEGMVRAVAEDVEKRRRAARPYAPTLAPTRSPGAMLYNSVA